MFFRDITTKIMFLYDDDDDYDLKQTTYPQIREKK